MQNSNLSVKLFRDNSGTTAIENALIIAFIAIVLIASSNAIGGAIENVLGDATNIIDTNGTPQSTDDSAPLDSDNTSPN